MKRKRLWLLIPCLLLLLCLGVVLSYRIFWSTHRDIRKQAQAAYVQTVPPLRAQEKAPNIILIFCDDLGYSDISAFGAEAIQTPNIDLMAAEGMTLTQHYSASPTCTPSRAAMLTGRYSLRTHARTVLFPTIGDWKAKFNAYGGMLINNYSYGMKGISPDEITIAEALKARGYATGMLGKWHLGDREGFLPRDNGFDSFFGALNSNDQEPYEYYRNETVELKAPLDQSILTKKLTQEGVSFIKEHKDAPFFLYYAQPFPHYPAHAGEAFAGSSHGGTYGDCVQEIDWSVGELVKTLEEEGLTDNTLLLFTSDNGPYYEGDAGNHRGRKGNGFEGGSKVPFIAKWPGVIPKGKQADTVSSGLDLFPTILGMTETPLPQDRVIDGKDILPILKGESTQTPHDRLFVIKDKKIVAVRQGDYKYHVRTNSDMGNFSRAKQGPFLFDLSDDPREAYSLDSLMPEKAQEMADMITGFEQELRENLRGWKGTAKE